MPPWRRRCSSASTPCKSTSTRSSPSSGWSTMVSRIDGCAPCCSTWLRRTRRQVTCRWGMTAGSPGCWVSTSRPPLWASWCCSRRTTLSSPPAISCCSPRWLQAPGCHGVRLSAVGAGRVHRVVAALAVANYLIALAATAIAPLAMPILLLATMLPAVLAVPYVSRRQLHGYVVGSFATPLGVAALGSLQDVTGFRDVLPWWLESGVVIFFIPFMSSMVSIIALTNADCARRERGRTARFAGTRRGIRRRERRRIERDLHDGAQQVLVAAKVQLANLRHEVMRVDTTLGSRFDEVRDQLRRASVELRDLARGVHPIALTEGGLGPALRHAAASFPEMRRWTSAQRGASIPKWSEPCTSVSRRPCRRLQARWRRDSVRLVLDGDESALRFAVSDDGRGFDPTATSVGTGLDNMLDRLGGVGGELTVSTSLGHGTTISGAAPACPVPPAWPISELQPALPRAPAGQLARCRPLADCGPQH